MTSPGRSAIARMVPLTALAFALTSAPAAGQEIRIPHGQGETVLSSTPQKVAVFDLATLDILDALGVDAVAAVPKPADRPGNFPAYLSAYNDERYLPAGSLFEPDIAVLEALEPDLIVVGGRSRSSYDAVSAVAPTVDLGAGSGDFLTGLAERTELLGRIFGVEDRAARLVDELDAALEIVHAAAGTAGTGLLIFAAGEGYNVQFPDSRFGAVYEVAGIAPAFTPAPGTETGGGRAQPGSPEAEAARERQNQINADALAADPDWIFVIDRNAAFGEAGTLAERLAEDPRVTATRAWQYDQVIYLDATVWYLVGGGYQGVLATAETVGDAFSQAGL